MLLADKVELSSPIKAGLPYGAYRLVNKTGKVILSAVWYCIMCFWWKVLNITLCVLVNW